MKIGEYLISKGKLTEAQVKDALFVQSISEKRLGDILIENGYVNDTDVAVYLAQDSGREYFGELNSEAVNKSESEKLGFNFLYDNPAIIIEKDGENYIVCGGITGSISERMALDKNLNGFKIGISTKKKIYEALNKTFINKSGSSEKEILNEALEVALLKGSPNVRIKRSENFYLIIIDMENGQETIKILNLESGQRIINIIAANCQITLKKGEGAGAKFIFVSSVYKGVKANVRVAFLPISSKLDRELALFEAVLRIHGFNKVFDLRYIGFSDNKAETLRKSYTYPNGFIISTGPTGSGKTTTFYAMLKLLAQKKRSILTIEDPVEIELKEPNITQMNISDDFGYAEAVRIMLRSEPHIMMIGEIRDEITAKHALIAAETGHLVLATLHANSSISAFNRVKSLNVDLMQFFSLLRIVTAQRLYNPLCPACKKSISADTLPSLYRDALEENLKFTLDNRSLKDLHYINPKGVYELKGVSEFNSVCVRGERYCAGCGGTGYIKRKPMIEIAEFNDAVKEEIYNDLNILSNNSKLEQILINLSNFESLKIQAFQSLIDGEIDPVTYFNLSR